MVDAKGSKALDTQDGDGVVGGEKGMPAEESVKERMV